MEPTTKRSRFTYWIKYVSFWIIFGAICEMIGFSFNIAIIGALSLLLPDCIFGKKKNKPTY